MSSLETDFNNPPYFDDFDEDKRFHRVLFRPSVAVQARELTQLQTITQEQIKRFGNHTFKDGSIVDGVSIAYYPRLEYISIEDNFYYSNGVIAEIVPSRDILSSYVVTNSTDSNTAVRATVRLAKDGTRLNPPFTNRLYLDYLYTGTNSSLEDSNIFSPGDTLYIYANNQSKFGSLNSDNLLYTVNTLETNSTFFADGLAYGISVSEGVIFQKGYFSLVTPQVITVNEFNAFDVDGYVVGFETKEEIINENDDTSLLDNALGYPNENAPGAHRLRLSPTLVAKQATDSTNNINFFAIVEFDGQTPVEQKDNPEYNKVLDQFAKRTYEESGNYVIKPFSVEARNNSANNEIFSYDVSSGIAYVRGYRIEKLGFTKVETEKATTTEVSQNQIVTANYGNYVICDEFLGVFDTEQLSEVTLYDSPQNAISEYEGTSATPSGNIVGKANIRAVVYQDGVKGFPTTQYLVYLFNVRMNSGKSFAADVKSMYMSGSNGEAKADLVLENGLAVLKESNRSNSVFGTGLTAVKRLTNNTGIGDTSYVYTQIKTTTLQSSGLLTLTIDSAGPGSSTETLNQTPGSILTGVSLDEYNIFLSSNAYSANLSGTVQITSGSNIITNGTSLDSQLSANSLIRIYANSTQTYIRRVVSIDSSSQITVDAPLPASNTSSNLQKYFVSGSPLELANVTINSTTSFSANIGLTLDSGNQTVYCSYPVFRNQAVSIPKIINKNRFVKIDCSNNAATSIGPWNLGLPDVHKIRNVYVGTTYSTTNPNKIHWFNLDTGQRDSVYDTARLIVKPQYSSEITSSTKILVELDHFTANTTASVGFFSVESYPVDDVNTSNTSAITTIEIPNYNNQDLRNLIDFRPYKSNTAVSSITESGATINPETNANVFSIPAAGQYMINPDSNFIADIEYYLPRYDALTLDRSGNFGVIKGSPSVRPIPPFVESDQMIIAESYVPPYPSATKREYDIYKSSPFIRVSVKRHKRYTMKDIGALEERIKRVEYYTVLNALEQDAKDLTIPDANGLDRFKNGIFADPFNSHNIGNVSDFEYKIAIDKEETVARPYFQKHDADFEFKSSNSSNVQVTGPVVTLPYTNELYISQRFATKHRIAAESFWQWNGLLDLYPSYDFFRDEETAPNINVTLDLAAPWEQFENSPFGTLYGDWRETNIDVDVNVNSTTQGRTTTTTTTTTTTIDSERTISDLTVDTFAETFEIGNYITDVSLSPYMRSRLVAFVARGMKPNTTLHAFFDDVLVDEHCAPGVLSGLTEVEEGREDRVVNQLGNFGDELVSDSNGFICGIFRIPAQTFRTGDRLFQLTNTDDLITGADAKITISKGRYTADALSVTSQTATLTAIQPNLGIQQTTETRTDVIVDTNVSTVTVIRTGDGGGGGDGGSCFVAGCKVTMSDGSIKNIEDIVIGDVIKGKSGNNTVIDYDSPMLDNEARDPILYSINGSIPFVTPEHPFMTKDGWKSPNPEETWRLKPSIRYLNVGQLQVGDEIELEDGSYLKIESLVMHENQPQQQVHNFILDGDHTYYVDNMLVHNRDGSCFISGSQVTLSDGTKKNIEDIVIGDVIKGKSGNNTVIDYNSPMIENEVRRNGEDWRPSLYSINGSIPFVTPEHPFMTKDGWKSPEPDETWRLKPSIRYLNVRKLEVGDEIELEDGSYLKIESLEKHEDQPQQQVHNFYLDGDHTYYVNDMLVHNRDAGDGDASGGGDPIAQSFSIESLPESISSVFVSQVGVYFKQKDPELGCTLYICEMVNGFPDANKIVGKSYLPSSSISLSDDATAETIFTFEYPICLLNNTDYTFVVQPDANSPEYVIWTAETGNFDIITDEQVFVNPYIGMMFLSANSKTWTEYQKEDLKFNLYRCNFNPLSGSAVFKNENDEFITAIGFSRANSSVGIAVGDLVYTVNGSISTQNTLNIASNTLIDKVYGRIQYVNEADGELWLDSSTANSTSYFSNTVNPIIAVYRSPDASNTDYINENTLIAYSNVASVDNLKYHAVVPKIGVIQPSKTNLSYSFKGTSTTNIIDTEGQNVINGYDYQFNDFERQIMSKSNEINAISGNKSAEFNVELSSQSTYVSPVLSLKKKSFLFVENLINNDDTNEYTRYGNALSKYVSKRIVLTDGQEAEDLKVYLTAYRPPDTDIKIYAKFWNNYDPEPFNDKLWTELKYDNEGDLVYSSVSNIRDFREFEFSVPNINSVPYQAFANIGVDVYNPLSGGVSIVESNTHIVAKEHTFNANTGVVNADDTIIITDANTYFGVGDEVVYNVDSGNTAIGGLVANNKYFVSFSNSTHLALSETRTGANIDITATSTSETGHYFTGTFFNRFFDVGDRIKIQSGSGYEAIRTITSISNNTFMTVDNGLEASNTAAVYYVFAPSGGDGIVEYSNPDGSRFIGYKEVALKIVLLSTNPVRVPRLNDVRAICLQV